MDHGACPTERHGLQRRPQERGAAPALQRAPRAGCECACRPESSRRPGSESVRVASSSRRSPELPETARVAARTIPEPAQIARRAVACRWPSCEPGRVASRSVAPESDKYTADCTGDPIASSSVAHSYAVARAPRPGTAGTSSRYPTTNKEARKRPGTRPATNHKIQNSKFKKLHKTHKE